MIEFRRPELSDREWVLPLLKLSDFRGCEYTFGNNYVWRNAFDLNIARYKNFYIVKNKKGFFFPAGKGDIAEALNELEGYCKEKEIPFVISSANTLSMMTLKEIYGERAEVYANTDDFDYIYRYEDLTELKGRKYHQKRNHIARFSENNWSYEEISTENIGECLEMNEEWLRRSGSENGRAEESAVAAESLQHFDELGYIGGILRVDGKIQAFTFGEPLNSDTFNVHVEKALTDFQGAYPMINRQFLLNSVHGFKFVNREEDTGEENLRKAKLSYYPCFMEEKFTVKIIRQKDGK